VRVYYFALIYNFIYAILLASTVGNSTEGSSEDVHDHRDSPRVSNYPPRQPEPSPNPPKRPKERESESIDTIHRLMWHPALYEPMRRPRYPIVLCHGTNSAVNSSRAYRASDSLILRRTIWLRRARPLFFSESPYAILVKRLDYFAEESGCRGDCDSCTRVRSIAVSF
jgi:hypothetical protein